MKIASNETMKLFLFKYSQTGSIYLKLISVQLLENFAKLLVWNIGIAKKRDKSMHFGAY